MGLVGHPTPMVWFTKNFCGLRDRFEHPAEDGNAPVPPVPKPHADTVIVIPDNGRDEEATKHAITLTELVRRYSLYPMSARNSNQGEPSAQGEDSR